MTDALYWDNLQEGVDFLREERPPSIRGDALPSRVLRKHFQSGRLVRVLVVLPEYSGDAALCGDCGRIWESDRSACAHLAHHSGQRNVDKRRAEALEREVRNVVDLYASVGWLVCKALPLKMVARLVHKGSRAAGDERAPWELA